MQYPKYQALSISPDYTIYTFISSGSKGDFEIEVQFTPIQDTGYYNLGFGALDNNRKIDDTIILNNGDRDKILATVTGFVDDFLKIYPKRQIFFSGSTSSRTRLYRRAISINYKELSTQFEILGFNIDNELTLEPFYPANNYAGFIVLKKITFEI